LSNDFSSNGGVCLLLCYNFFSTSLSTATSHSEKVAHVSTNAFGCRNKLVRKSSSLFYRPVALLLDSMAKRMCA
jgi:hypothetical protein